MSLPKRENTRRKNSALKPKECCACAVAALDRHLAIPIQGRLTQTDLFQALVVMVAMNQSVHSINGPLEQVPCETSFRYRLKKLDMEDLEQESTAILTHFVHHVLMPGNAYLFAIDSPTIPTTGRPRMRTNRIIRSKRKKSTNEFYSYITLYVTARDRQMTLAIYPVRQGISRSGILPAASIGSPSSALRSKHSALTGSSTPGRPSGF